MSQLDKQTLLLLEYDLKQDKKSRQEPNSIENVLVLQGGGSLGAYECGVFKILDKYGVKFDIVSGTSIGAVNASVKNLARHVRLLIEDLDLKIDSYDSSFFVSRVASVVSALEKSRRDALHILSKLKESGYAEGKNPIALAGAALYISCVFNGEKHTQKQIADAAGISTVTLRMRSESISKNFDIETLLKKGKKA